MPDRNDQSYGHVRKSLVTRPCLLASHKMGAPIACASPLEAEAAMLFEVDPDVTAYKAQPGSFSYGPLGMRRFVPDFEVVRRGCTRYVEVKPMRWARRPETNRELRAKKAAMESLGHEYRVLTEMELQREPRLSNVRQLFHCHQHGRTVADEVEVRRILGRCDGMSIDRLARAMVGIHAAARIMGLICGGVLSFDDRTALCPDTVVRLRGE